MSCTDRDKQRGAALVLVLMLMALFGLLGTAYLRVSSTESEISANNVDMALAFNLAEAGLSHASLNLASADVDAILLAGGDLVAEQSLGEGTYHVGIANNVSPEYPLGTIPADAGGATNETDGFFVVTSTGRMGNAVRAVSVVAKQTTGTVETGSGWALFAMINFVTKGSGIVYGNVGGNDRLKLGSTIDGDAQAAADVPKPEYVLGTVTEGADPEVFPMVPCPTGAYGPAPIGDGVDFDAGNGKLNIGGSDAVVWPGGTYYFHDMLAGGSSMQVMNAGETVEIYVYGSFKLNDVGFINPNNSASTLKIYGCGTDGSGWTLDTPNDQYMTMYAPYHQVGISGDGDKYGSFILEDVDYQGPGDVIYQGSSTTTSGSTSVEILPRTWSQANL